MYSEIEDNLNSFSEIIQEFRRFSRNEILGFYQRCEIIEIVGFYKNKSSPPFNVFSLVVLEDAAPSLARDFINKDKIIIPELKEQFFFGVYRYHLEIKDIDCALENYARNHVWNISGEVLTVGELCQVPAFFSPHDGTEITPLNNLLKNNFFNGSHILELFDQSKTHLSFLLENLPLIQKLSEKIQAYIPISIAGLSDRLGNILIQIPTNIVMCNFSFDNSAVKVTYAWHPKVDSSTRHCSIVSQSTHDGLILSYTSTPAVEPVTLLPNMVVGHLNRNFLWDNYYKCILAASNPLRPIGGNFSMRTSSSSIDYVRKITFLTKEGEKITKLVPLLDFGSEYSTKLRNTREFNYRGKINNRIYENEQKRLEDALEFVQYGLNRSNDHEKALDDVRKLINMHGEYGAWLWDPYLTHLEIMNTLFFCKYTYSNLRALGDFKQIRDLFKQEKKETQFDDWKKEQSVLMSQDNTNFKLKLEFRVRREDKGWGWGFHDRFLIFPSKDRRPSVWSLGTSINGLGKSHHVLQKVENGRLIQDAFQKLWDELNIDECQVCKYT